jgi:hypothetical protein
MAVVIHGSFDEGPVVLALPPYFEGAIRSGDEVDPKFTAWDRRTGISITKSQISDGGDLVPYTGATTDVNLGVHNISTNRVTINGSITNPTDGVTKSYVDGIVSSGVIWDTAVKDIVTTLPVSNQTLGDRYIKISDNSINEWNGTSWDSVIPSTGTTLYVEGNVLSPTNSIGQYTYNGTSWVYVGSSVKHNDTTDKEGGDNTYWYHIGLVANTLLSDLVSGDGNLSVNLLHIDRTTRGNLLLTDSNDGWVSDSHVRQTSTAVQVYDRTLDVSTTTGGLIVPRMTMANRNTLTTAGYATNGMMIYVTDDGAGQFHIRVDSEWHRILVSDPI